MKAVGILLSELNSQYEGTVNLCTAQLILLGDKAVPYMTSFLMDKINMQMDLIDYIKKRKKINDKWDKMGNERYIPKNSAKCEMTIKYLESKFKEKWGLDPIIPIGTWGDIKANPQELMLIGRVMRVFEYLDNKEGVTLAQNLISNMVSLEKLNPAKAKIPHQP